MCHGNDQNAVQAAASADQIALLQNEIAELHTTAGQMETKLKDTHQAHLDALLASVGPDSGMPSLLLLGLTQASVACFSVCSSNVW